MLSLLHLYTLIMVHSSDRHIGNGFALGLLDIMGYQLGLRENQEEDTVAAQNLLDEALQRERLQKKMTPGGMIPRAKSNE